MGRVREVGDYEQLLAQAKHYTPRCGAERQVLVHVRRLLVLGVETARRTGGRDGIRNERELSGVGALLSRYLPEVAVTRGVDLADVDVDLQPLLSRELAWWWLGGMQNSKSTSLRNISSRLSAVGRWVGAVSRWEPTSAVPPSLGRNAQNDITRQSLTGQQISDAFSWVKTVPSPVLARTVSATVALAYGTGLPMRILSQVKGEDISRDGSYVVVKGATLEARPEVQDVLALLSLVDGRVVKTNNPLTGLDKPSSFSLTPSILQATWATAQLAEGATLEQVCLRVPRATVLRCLDLARTFTLSEGLTLGMSHKALAPIPSQLVSERSLADARLPDTPASVEGLRLVSSQDAPLRTSISRPRLRLVTGGKS
ncbi:hypothetical protein FRC0337_01609 [Corynebacterium diphtheriae]|nr:hypothetical protein CIP101841_01721 [Corynebacterium diphtheriae]CAB0852694.1 hypothetical protein FRC0337_01609 [Corynebacterium diphtheriae]CAB1020609.1 hypothetical protein FRC0515_01757 [Corynebacterium diphtheriae]CAB1044994.1 hypothetical protein FRC0547_01817 [Corynebacterium diphtheriae]